MALRIDGLPDGRVGLGTGRGTGALIAAVRGLGLVGRDVLVPVNLCAIAVAGLLWAGARPVLHDVDPSTGSARLQDLDAAWKPGVAGILVVHTFGVPVEIDAVAQWAAGHGVAVIEDCCHSVGATWHGRPAGTFGHAAIYSFGRAKTVDAGGGGAVSAADPSLLARIGAEIDSFPEFSQAAGEADEAMETTLRALRRTCGTPAAHRAAYEAYRPFVASRMDPDNALRVGKALANLSKNVADRRALAMRWQDRLAGGPAHPVALPDGSVPWRFNILLDPSLRDGVVTALRAAGHPASTWYPPVAALFGGEAVTAAHYPGAQRFAERVINLWVDSATDATGVDAAAGLIHDAVDTTE